MIKNRRLLIIALNRYSAVEASLLRAWDRYELAAELRKRNVLDHLVQLVLDNGVTGAIVADGLI